MKAEYDFSSAECGPIMPPRAGTPLIRFHIHDEILDWFRGRVHQTGGGDIAELMNDVLREYVRR